MVLVFGLKTRITISIDKDVLERVRGLTRRHGIAVSELAEKHGLLYEELLWRALDAYTQSNRVSKGERKEI
jgi:transposase-like protein